MTPANADVAVPQAAAPTFAELVSVSFRIGCLSFGGPAGQIALMHRMLVDERKWIDEKSYLNALNFCMLLPGPEAMQLATYVGWRLRGVAGGLVSGLLFVLPGAVVMLLLSALYAAFGNVPIATALLTGVKAAVLAIVIEALVRIARRGLKTSFDQALAAIAFVAIFFFALPFPIIVLAAALIGFLRGRGDLPQGAQAPSVALMDTVRTVAVWLAVWIAPLLAIAALFGSGHVLSQIAWFFSKLAMVTFGGAYAVLAYMAQDVVKFYGWLAPGEMVDGLGLAETTPGPLILVTQFVGFLAAFRNGGGSGVSAWIMGSLGALVTLWATFAPCFLWIFAGAPYVEQINRQPALKSALAGVTAAVVGVILNLTVWFALNVLFRRVSDTWVGPLHLHVPDLSTLDPVALSLAVLAFVLIMVRHVGIITTLCVCGGLSLAIHFLGGAG